MGMDGRTHTGVRKPQAKDHGDTMSGPLQLRLLKRDNNRGQYKRPRCNSMARTTRWEIKTDRFCKPISIRH